MLHWLLQATEGQSYRFRRINNITDYDLEVHMKLNGSEIIVECLKEQNVDTVFGYPGGAILNVYDALYKHSDEITHILTSHEQGASHAADGYARATGKVGVCFATSGPGATNLVTGIATAYMDSIPVVAITCNVTVPLLGRDSFQEIDIAGVTMPITKHNYIVKDINVLADTIRSAFRIAKEGRPGPVLIDVTKDVTAAVCDYIKETPKTVERVTDTINEADVEKAVEMIKASKKPYIFVGGGVIASEASDELKKFVKKVDAPVTDSLMGKGAFDGTDKHYTGMLGMHGTKASNFGVSECDLLIVIGARFSDRVTGNAKKFAKKAKILQFDVDAAEINKNIKTDASVVGDALEILKRVNAKLEQADRHEWLAHIREYEKKYPLAYRKDCLNGPYVMSKIYEITNGDAVIVTDVGQHQMWAAQHYYFKNPRTLLTSGGLGTMGYGLGAAIGAKVGRKDKTVVNIAGDGCFRMNMNELATATRYNIPIIEVIFNNHVLGMVRQWQDLFYGQRYSATVLEDSVDFVKVSEGMGAKAYRVTTIEEFEAAFKEAVELNIPCVIECVIGKDDKVFPMVAPGTAISEAFDRKDLDRMEAEKKLSKK
jgi:acetolactate synthase-1/2/3 large subunit